MKSDDLLFFGDRVFLVTGGAGFIGSHLCETILHNSGRVRCLDNLSTGKRDNIAPFLCNPCFEFIEGDICDYDTCLKACEGVDFVLHQAAWGSVPRSIEMPRVYEENNIRGTLNMMEAAREQGVKRFVYASSSSVYGENAPLPMREGQEGALLSPYALTKRTAEEYGKLYTRLYGLETFGLRYFNVFGPRQNPDGTYAAAIPKWIGQLLSGETPTIYGDGLQSRDFTYVANVVQANLRACAAPPEAAGDVYNIACGGCEMLRDIYDRLCAALGKTVTPQTAPARVGEIRHSNADISKAREKLGYEPLWTFAEGLETTVAWYRETRGV